MSIRIMQIRADRANGQTSQLSRGLHSLSVGVFGGSAYGVDPEKQYQQDLVDLQAYHQRLTAMGCETFNFDQELGVKTASVS